MNDMIRRVDQPLLTLGDVRRMEDEKAHLEAKIKSLQAELMQLNRKLEAAALFLPNHPQREAVSAEPEHDDGETALPTIVLAVLSQSARPMKPKEIRKQIDQYDFWRARMEANPNYLYTVMMRLVRRGKVVKDQGGFRLAPQE